MIKILIEARGDKILDNFDSKNTTLVENSVVLRRLKEIELALLEMEYESDVEIDSRGVDEGEEDEDDYYEVDGENSQ